MNVRSLLAALVFFAAASSVARAAGEDKPVTDQEIKSVVDSHMADLKPCLSADNGVAGGKLRVAIYIEPDGHVSSTKVNKSSNNDKIDACIAKQVAKLHFPKPRNKQMWLSSYLFTFSVPKTVVGTLTEDQIIGAIGPRMKDVHTCYDEAVKKKPDIAGQLDLGIAVSPAGSVAGIETLSSSTGSPELDACVIGKVQTVAFPKPTNNGEASFKYPFVFKPSAKTDKKADDKKADDKKDAK